MKTKYTFNALTQEFDKINVPSVLEFSGFVDRADLVDSARFLYNIGLSSSKPSVYFATGKKEFCVAVTIDGSVQYLIPEDPAGTLLADYYTDGTLYVDGGVTYYRAAGVLTELPSTGAVNIHTVGNGTTVVLSKGINIISQAAVASTLLVRYNEPFVDSRTTFLVVKTYTQLALSHNLNSSLYNFKIDSSLGNSPVLTAGRVYVLKYSETPYTADRSKGLLLLSGVYYTHSESFSTTNPVI